MKATRDLVWGAALAVRHAPDRLLHGQRRRAALRLAARLRPHSVLFVCRGNLCRSPYAADRLRALLLREPAGCVTIQSAGLLAAGRRPPAAVLDAARRMGGDLGHHRSRRVTGDLIRQAELILAMEPEQQRVMGSAFPDAPGRVMLLGDFDPRPVATRAIVDPYGQPPDVMLECFQRIDRCVQAVAACLRTASSLVA